MSSSEDSYGPETVPPSAQLSRSPTLRDEPQFPPSHDPNRADLSYPEQTTEVEKFGVSGEYRQTSPTGLVPAPFDVIKGIAEQHTSPVSPSISSLEKGQTSIQLVVWKDNDPEDPRNWSKGYRWYLTTLFAGSVLAVAFGSSVITGDFKDIEEEFQISEVVAALTVSLMVVGFGLGPLVFGPLSELFGRRPLWIAPMLLYVIFNIPVALAKNLGTLLVSRFLCGLFASAPLTLAGGAISDIWDNDERGLAIALFAAAPYGGPVLGPLVGGFIGDSVGWRWIIWVNMIFAGVVLLFLLTVPETFAPVLLRKRAQKLRQKEGNSNIYTQQELSRPPFSELLIDTLVRPFTMLVTEPILLLMSLYISVIYGLLYGFFFSFPVIFGEGWGFSDSKVGLTFISVLIGVAFALLVTPQLEKTYVQRLRERGGKPLPEDRLVGMMIGAPFPVVALFMMGWTSPPYVAPHGGNWVGLCVSGVLFGFGMVIIYFSANAYLIDSFPSYVASVLASKTVVRSGMGAAIPLFIVPMYHNLGNGWAASVFAFISLAVMPIPFLFYRYGGIIRGKSKRAAANL
ncbi:hypothetical protein EYR36_001610 [Pleurotus pulmonarius]|nr:hypothetical protein EYR36_008447 [Pleurotus pulmonarius]KAF4579791.1 hypothetical protein EYR36_001610 [Pleurotus pulmonarius]